jgi:hypothetical protein
VDIPDVGSLTKDDSVGWHHTEPIAVPSLRGQICRLILEEYEEDPNKEDFHRAIKNLLSPDRDLLSDAEPFIYEYYKDMMSNWAPGDPEFIEIKRENLWQHVQLGETPVITRRPYGDKGVYVSFECNCDWEPEHGLQLVFKDGCTVNKVGPFDGHLTNSDSFADNRLEDVVYAGSS